MSKARDLANLIASGSILADGTLASTEIDGVTASSAELNILDGVTSTTAELNILDGVTSTAAELNILDGVTSTAAELNILDGVTANATEINKLDALSRGSILYGDASGATAILTKGSANQILKSDGTDIAWGAAAAGGTSGMQVLSTVTASNSATVDLETTFDSTYDDYIIMISNLVAATDSVNFLMRQKLGGTYQTAGYAGMFVNSHSGTTTNQFENGFTNGILLANSFGNASYESGQVQIYVSNVHSTSRVKNIYGQSSYVTNEGKSKGGRAVGFCGAATSALTGLRFYFSSGNISAGNFRVYGVAKS